MKILISILLFAGATYAATSPKSCPYKNSNAAVRMHASTNPTAKKISVSNRVKTIKNVKAVR